MVSCLVLLTLMLSGNSLSIKLIFVSIPANSAFESLIHLLARENQIFKQVNRRLNFLSPFRVCLRRTCHEWYKEFSAIY